jgi:UDPglucose 6-dehydrogenase
MEIKNTKIGVIGLGMVGGALQRYFERKSVELFLYDKDKKIGSSDEVMKADYIYICVPTPPTTDFHCDVSIVEEVVKLIDEKKTGKKVVIIKSTVVPGTTERLQKQYPDLVLLFNPEFLTELKADYDMCYPERQIVGYTSNSLLEAKEVLEQLPRASFEKIISATEAEMVKYFGNCFLAVKVIFANQMYDLCQKLNINYNIVKDAVVGDSRIGQSHLEIWHNGYRGYGDMVVSKCLPKDSKALIKFADDLGIDLELLKVVDKTNTNLWQKFS